MHGLSWTRCSRCLARHSHQWQSQDSVAPTHRLEATMFPTITLIVTRGPLAGQKYTFNQPTACTVGRARDCTISLPLEAEHLDVSRHHCLLDISPPDVRIRDLGSLNGTYVNGRKIGQRDGPRGTLGLRTSTFAGRRVDRRGRGPAGRQHGVPRVHPGFDRPRTESSRTRRASSGEIRV